MRDHIVDCLADTAERLAWSAGGYPMLNCRVGDNNEFLARFILNEWIKSKVVMMLMMAMNAMRTTSPTRKVCDVSP